MKIPILRTVSNRRRGLALCLGILVSLVPRISVAEVRTAETGGSFPPPDYVRAVTASSREDHGTARDLFLQLLREDPDNSRVADRLVREYIRLREVPAGLVELEKLARAHPKATAALGALAQLHEAQKQPLVAEDLLRRAVLQGSRYPADYYRLLSYKRQENTLTEAEAFLDSLAAARPGDAVLLYARGIRAWLAGDLNLATDWLVHAMAADPDLLEAYIALGDVQRQNQSTTASYQTWQDGLTRSTALRDREYQFQFLFRLGEAYWNAVAPETAAYFEEAIPLGETLGELQAAGGMRTKLIQIEKTFGRFDRMTYWAREEIQRVLARGDSTGAFGRLTFLAGLLENIGEGTTAAGALEQALAVLPVGGIPESRIQAEFHLARLRLRLGDLDGAVRLARRAEAGAAGVSRPGELLVLDRLRGALVLGHEAFLSGRTAEAESIYRSARERPVGGRGLGAQAEASMMLVRILRERGDLAAAREAFTGAQLAVTAGRDSLSSGLSDLEELDLLSAEGNAEPLRRRAQEILNRPGTVLPVGLRARAALALAGVALPSHPEEGLDALLLAWRISERDTERQPMIFLPEALRPDPEEPLERLALFFAQLALRPGKTPERDWTPPVPTGHEPQTPEGILAARWSYFFAERRAQRILEKAASSGFGAPLPAASPAMRERLWEEAAASARAAGLALMAGRLPAKTETGQPLLGESDLRARTQILNFAPEYSRLPWLMSPTETGDIQRALAPRGETLMQTVCLERVTLLFLFQSDRLRLVPVPIRRQELVRRIRDWLPYYELGCATPNTERLPSDFEPAGELFHWFLGPAGESADLSKTLWIVPDGPLWYLPFESLAPAGGKVTQPDRGALLDQAGALPLAVDRHRIAYLPDAGILLAKPRTASSGSSPESVRIVLSPRRETDSAPDNLELDGCAAEGPDGGLSAWRRPPCEPLASTLRDMTAEAGGRCGILEPSEPALRAVAPAHSTFLFAPTFYHAAEPWLGGLLLDGKRQSEADGFLRWTELARLPAGEFLALPEAAACGLAIASPVLNPSSWGREIVLPALMAAFAGYQAAAQGLWNAGEASWIPLAFLLRPGAGADLDLFLSERQRLRATTLPAGASHRLSLGHPFFSCSLRWWQLDPPRVR